jgi:flavin reductase (DIM6/NTAB) family NADH-FMN oxidoreductase RutF
VEQARTVLSIMFLDSKSLRRTLGRFATGVTIITARAADGRPIGLTCNSFSSVSLEPPLVQWSIAKTSRNHELMRLVSHFAVHILDVSQGDLCRCFSAKEGDRFGNVELEVGLYDLPLLRRHHARFECETYARHEAGDHTIIIGRVLRLSEQEGEPLIFYRGELSRIEARSP